MHIELLAVIALFIIMLVTTYYVVKNRIEWMQREALMRSYPDR